jgi:hypothetical protein
MDVSAPVVDAEGTHTYYTVFNDVAHTEQIAQIHWVAA